MKKSMFIAGAAALLAVVSCKKAETTDVNNVDSTTTAVVMDNDTLPVMDDTLNVNSTGTASAAPVTTSEVDADGKRVEVETRVDAAGKKIENAANKTGAAIENAADKTGDAVKDAANATGNAIKKGANDVKDAARKATDGDGDIRR